MATRPTSTTPRTAEEAQEPREELLSGSTPGATPKGEGVMERDDPADRAQEGADERAASGRAQPEAPPKIR